MTFQTSLEFDFKSEPSMIMSPPRIENLLLEIDSTIKTPITNSNLGLNVDTPTSTFKLDDSFSLLKDEKWDGMENLLNAKPTEHKMQDPRMSIFDLNSINESDLFQTGEDLGRFSLYIPHISPAKTGGIKSLQQKINVQNKENTLPNQLPSSQPVVSKLAKKENPPISAPVETASSSNDRVLKQDRKEIEINRESPILEKDEQLSLSQLELPTTTPTPIPTQVSVPIKTTASKLAQPPTKLAKPQSNLKTITPPLTNVITKPSTSNVTAKTSAAPVKSTGIKTVTGLKKGTATSTATTTQSKAPSKATTTTQLPKKLSEVPQTQPIISTIKEASHSHSNSSSMELSSSTSSNTLEDRVKILESQNYDLQTRLLALEQLVKTLTSK